MYSRGFALAIVLLLVVTITVVAGNAIYLHYNYPFSSHPSKSEPQSLSDFASPSTTPASTTNTSSASQISLAQAETLIVQCEVRSIDISIGVPDQHITVTVKNGDHLFVSQLDYSAVLGIDSANEAASSSCGLVPISGGIYVPYGGPPGSP